MPGESTECSKQEGKQGRKEGRKGPSQSVIHSHTVPCDYYVNIPSIQNIVPAPARNFFRKSNVQRNEHTLESLYGTLYDHRFFGRKINKSSMFLTSVTRKNNKCMVAFCPCRILCRRQNKPVRFPKVGKCFEGKILEQFDGTTAKTPDVEGYFVRIF